MDDIVRAKRPQRLPVIWTRRKAQSWLAAVDGADWIMARHLRGSGLRLMECLRLRVKDIELTRNEIVVSEGNGNRYRVTMLPAVVNDALREHLRHVHKVHTADLGAGYRLHPNRFATSKPSGSQ